MGWEYVCFSEIWGIYPQDTAIWTSKVRGGEVSLSMATQAGRMPQLGWWWRRRSSWQTQKRRLHVGRKAKGHVRLDLQKSGTSSEVIDTLANLDSGATDFLRWLGSARWVRSPQMRCQWTRTHAWPSQSQHPQAETWARPSSHSRCNPTHLRIGARVLPWASRWWLSLTSRKLVGRSPIMFKQNHIFWPWHTRELGLIPWIVMKKSGFSYQLWVWTCPKSGNTWYLKLWMCECAGLGYEGRIQEWLPHDLMGIE